MIDLNLIANQPRRRKIDFERINSERAVVLPALCVAEQRTIGETLLHRLVELRLAEVTELSDQTQQNAETPPPAAAADATLRPSYSWSTYAIFSSEMTLEEKVKSDGGQWTGGMAVRFSGHRCQRRQWGGRQSHYGDAEPDLAALRTHRARIGSASDRRRFASGCCKAQRDGLDAANKLAGAGAKGAHSRAAIPFALLQIAGRLAQQFGVLPASVDLREPIYAAWRGYITSSGAAALDPLDHAIDAVCAYIAEGWDVTIKNIDTMSRFNNNREARGWYNDDIVYLPTERLREALRGIVKEQQFARSLKEVGLLSNCDKCRLQVKYVPGVGGVLSYALRRDKFKSRENQDDNDDRYDGYDHKDAVASWPAGFDDQFCTNRPH